MQDFKTPLDMAANEETKALLREHGGKFSFLGAVEKGMLEESFRSSSRRVLT